MQEEIRELSIFDSLSDEEFEQAFEHLRTRTLDPDDILLEQGEEGDRLFVIISGLLRVMRKSEELERDKILTYLDEGSVVGEMAVLGEGDRSATVKAVRPTSLLEITRSDFENLCQVSSSIPMNMLTILSRRLYTSNMEIEAVTFRTVPGRLAIKLLRLGEEFGEMEDEGVKIPFALTHKNLADLVGTNRETVTRYINEFLSQEAIDVDDHIYTILDRSKLENWI